MSIRLTRYGIRTTSMVTAAAVLFLLIIGVMMSVRIAYAESSNVSQSGRHVLRIYDHGREQGIMTDAATVGEALDKAGIKLSQYDVTEPARDEALVGANYDVTIYRARPVAVYDAGRITKVMSAYRTATQVARQAGIELHDEDVAQLESSTDITADGALEKLVITRATPFTFVFYGKTMTSFTLAKTVGEMLDQKHITLGDSDTLSVAASTPIVAGMSVEVWREGRQTATVEEDIDYRTEKINDANRDVGYREVQTAGEKGRRTVTYEVVVKNGQEDSRTEISSVVTKEPKTEVVVVGTKVELPAGSHTDWMAAAGISASDYGYVDYIVGRESGWSPTKSNYAGSGAYGLCQALPASKMASAGGDYMTNPITQLRWCNSYAVGRYGSWANAYGFWTSNHWW